MPPPDVNCGPADGQNVLMLQSLQRSSVLFSATPTPVLSASSLHPRDRVPLVEQLSLCHWWIKLLGSTASITISTASSPTNGRTASSPTSPTTAAPSSTPSSAAGSLAANGGVAAFIAGFLAV